MGRSTLLPPSLALAALLAAATALAVLPAASGAADPSAGTCAFPAVTPAPAVSPPGCGEPGPAPLAVIDITGEVYRIELITPAALEGARALLAGTGSATIPNSMIVRGDPGPNAPWSWHIDPATLEWADMTIELCDGLPSHIEDDVLTIDQFCPWSARVIAIEGDPGAPPALPPGEPDILPIDATGGSTTEDRTLARRVVLEGGDYALRWTTGAQLDLTMSTCPARILLLDEQRQPAGGSSGTDPDLAPYEEGEIAFKAVPTGAYDLFVSIDCAWTVSFDQTGSASGS